MKQETIYDNDKASVLQIIGQIEYEDRELLSKKFQEFTQREKKVVVLELGSMNYIGSAGIGIIANFNKKIDAQGGKLYLLNTQPEVKKIFDNIGLGSLMAFTDGSYEDLIKEAK